MPMLNAAQEVPAHPLAGTRAASPGRVAVTRLRLTDFRNYREVGLVLDG